MSDMASMPIRDLIADLKSRAAKLDPGQLALTLVLKCLAGRMEEQANEIDSLKEEIYDCENNEDFHGHTMVEKP